jgi:hypothetical protein
MTEGVTQQWVGNDEREAEFITRGRGVSAVALFESMSAQEIWDGSLSYWTPMSAMNVGKPPRSGGWSGIA